MKCYCVVLWINNECIIMFMHMIKYRYRRWPFLRDKRIFVIACILVIGLIIPFAVSAIQNVFVASRKVVDVQIGSTPINKVYMGDKLVWERCDVPVGQEYRFAYIGSRQAFTVPCEGKYQIELWGAKGGGGKGGGGYTKGTIKLSKGTVLGVYVGGVGGGYDTNCGSYNGGWNGGARGGMNVSGCGFGGSGGTDIRTVIGYWNDVASLNSRIMVAGGGGGVQIDGGGYGGGMWGGTGVHVASPSIFAPYQGLGGSQIAGGVSPTKYVDAQTTGDPGTFGRGGNGGKNGVGSTSGGGGGGGGGWYGGSGASGASEAGGAFSGGGGSSYISGRTGMVGVTADGVPKPGCVTNTTDNACSISHTGYVFTNTQLINGSQTMPHPTSGETEVGHGGNGYAKITLIEY